MSITGKKIIEYLSKADNTLSNLIKDFDKFDFTNSRRDNIIESRNNILVLRIYFEGEEESMKKSEGIKS